EALRRDRKAVLLRTVGEALKDSLAQVQQGRCVRKPALETVREQCEARAHVPDYLRLGKIDLLAGRRGCADVDDLRPPCSLQEWRLLDGVMPDRDDQVGLIDRPMHPVSLG